MMPLLLAGMQVPAALNPAPALHLAQLAWMAGSWRGEVAGGFIEEHWSFSPGHPMFGMFRRVEGGQVKFAELLTCFEENGQVIFRIRHFSGDLGRALEAADGPMEFRLVAVDGQEARFKGQGAETGTTVVYRRTAEGLEAVLDKGSGATAKRLVLRFKPGALK